MFDSHTLPPVFNNLQTTKSLGNQFTTGAPIAAVHAQSGDPPRISFARISQSGNATFAVTFVSLYDLPPDQKHRYRYPPVIACGLSCALWDQFWNSNLSLFCGFWFSAARLGFEECSAERSRYSKMQTLPLKLSAVGASSTRYMVISRYEGLQSVAVQNETHIEPTCCVRGSVN